jgi:hypothetical protein
MEEIARILAEIRICGANTHFDGTDNAKINRLIAWHSRRVLQRLNTNQAAEPPENRVAVSTHITRAYFSPPHCKYCNYDCKRVDGYEITPSFWFQVRGPCHPQLNNGGEKT